MARRPANPAPPIPSFDEWHSRWINKQETRRALALLREVGGTEQHQAITRQRIIRACYEAAHYQPDRDPGQIYRRQLREERKRRAPLIKAARVLKLAAERNDKTLMWAMAYAKQSAGMRLVQHNVTNLMPMPLHQVAASYFAHLEKELSGRLPELDGGPFLQRFTVGNLHFDKALAAGRPITTSTMLAFELTVYLRMHTGGHAEDATQEGMPMPVYKSDPCYTVVTAFCNAALDITVWLEQIRENVRKLKNVSLMSWPKPE